MKIKSILFGFLIVSIFASPTLAMDNQSSKLLDRQGEGSDTVINVPEGIQVANDQRVERQGAYCCCFRSKNRCKTFWKNIGLSLVFGANVANVIYNQCGSSDSFGSDLYMFVVGSDVLLAFCYLMFLNPPCAQFFCPFGYTEEGEQLC